MAHIIIISASVRTGRQSHRVALFFQKFIEERKLATAEILDLMQYRFPLFDERLKYQPEPSAQVLDFVGRIRSADGIIIVTPEYNGGYPASIKNVIDLLYDDWKKKPIALATVSDGQFGATQVMTSLLFTLWKIGAWVVPAMYPVPKVHDNYDEVGNAVNKDATEKRAKVFVDELLWCVEAKKRMST